MFVICIVFDEVNVFLNISIIFLPHRYICLGILSSWMTQQLITSWVANDVGTKYVCSSNNI